AESHSLTSVDSLGYNCRCSRLRCQEKITYAKTVRPSAGHRRSVDPANHFARAAARLGHLQAHPAALRRRAVGAAGIALSGATPTGAKRMDRVRMERHRTGTQCQVLRTHARGQASAGTGVGKLEPAVFRGRIGSQESLTYVLAEGPWRGSALRRPPIH